MQKCTCIGFEIKFTLVERFSHLCFNLLVPNVQAYNDVDNLKTVVAKNTAMRQQKEMTEVEHLFREEAPSFCGWRESSLAAIPSSFKRKQTL